MKKTIEIEAFETPDGKPTCALDIGKKQFCQFLRVTRMGMCDICALDDDRRNYLDRYPHSRDGKAYNGYLIPSEKCIVWSTK